MSVVTTALAAGTLAAAPVQSADRKPPTAAHTKPVPVHPVTSHYRAPKKLLTKPSAKVVWPSGTATVTVPAAPDTGTGRTGKTKGSASAAPPVRAGTLPVWLGPLTNRPGKPDKPGRKRPSRQSTSADVASASASSSAASAQVRVLPQSAASAAGIGGVLLEVSPSTASRLHLSLDYSSFAGAFGGDWSSRLRFQMLPGCALTTPQKASCRVGTPLATSNDTHARRLGADLPTPRVSSVPAKNASPSERTGGTARTATASALAQPMVLAASSTSSGGGGGDFTATDLKASGSWQAGGSADAFTWSYPINVPAVPGDLSPNLSLGYDSQSVDGLTSSTNNQASVVGDGFSLSDNFIERSYQSCHQNASGTTKTWDNCWSSDNQLTMSLNGQTTTLIKDDSSGVYHAQDDTNEKVEYLTGATNGAQSGEYWRVTTDDGTQYTFGLNELPGYSSGKATTNSVLTEPVYATSSGQPCYNSTFASSYCQQAYRWMLDYVKDTHSDTVSYFYTADTAYYARDLGTTANTPYIRDAYLSKIQYGQRDGSVYSTSPAGQVLFTYNGRCNTSSTGCATSTLSSSTSSSWPDVPYDQYCAQNASCSNNAPTFWSEEELTGIQTQALVGSTETNVDSWALAYAFPATGDATTASLWLSSITLTGQDTSGGGSSSSIAAKPVTFSGTPLSNRVNLTDGYPPITRYRLNTITTETGEIISVGYSAPACGSSTPSDPSQNTSLCYPEYWTPSGQTSPVEDWFNKYIVTGVTEQDPTGGGVSDTIATTYTPVGSPAWHYNDNPLTPSAERTWSQWRGYQGMKVTVGTSPDPQTETDYTYFRGMDGDTLSGGKTRTATVTDSRSDTAITDADQYAGLTYEAIVYNGKGSSSVVTDTVTDPWTSSATATHALSGGLPSQQSFHTGTAKTRVYTPLASGSTRETETDYTHDSYGRVTKTDDLADVSTSSDDLCTTVTYDDSTSAWILDTPDETQTVSVKCATTPTLPGNAVSDTRTYYDNATTFGTAPTTGDATTTQQASSYSGSTPTYTTLSTTTVDEYGRTLTATDADSRKTTTAYTPTTGAEPTGATVTDPLSHTTTTVYDPLRELPTKVTDAAGYVSSAQIDALGRTTAVFKPGVTAATAKYSYSVSNTAPTVVTTQTLNNDGSTYRTSETLYDALLRTRETQTATEDGGRDVTDTVYNTDGQVAKTAAPYYNKGTLSSTLVQAQDGDIPSETGFTYDGAGRKTAQTAYALGSQTWQTTYTYGGNFTTAVPPAGATAQSVITDARGRTTDLYQYHSGVSADPVKDSSSDYSDTKYTYTPDGKQASEQDAAGNSWSWTYDLLGRQTKAVDPDTGTTSSTYDNAGQLLTVTNGDNDQATYSYDLDGRKSFAYDTTGGATASSSNEIGAWTYDTLKKGYPTASTSYQKGTTSAAVTSTTLAYNSFAQAAASKITLANLPSNESALAPSSGYITSYSYNTVGALTTLGDPAEGGLPSENIGIGYDTYGQPTSLASGGTTAWSYATAIGYDEYGKPVQYTMGPSTSWVDLTLSYDAQTNAVTDAKTTDSTSSKVVDDTAYSYQNTGVSKGAGLVVATADKQNGGATSDTQCFTYDYATRLNAAWTATDACAATPSTGSSSSVGGTNPYWQSWTFDTAGDRLTETDHDTGGTTSKDTTTTYHYPTAGSSSDQPHTLTSTTASGPGATANTANYVYDASGNTTAITGGALGNQTLKWNDQGKLSTDTTTAGGTSYLYDSDGNLVLRTDPSTATLFIGDAQITENLSTSALTGTRYYSVGGATVAERSSTGDIQYLIPDRQGTDLLTVDYKTQAATRRQYTPFGTTRGTAPTTWPGDKGYVGGTPDTTTQLENLGAREYDTQSGRFLSADPLLETTDPTQIGGYDYAGNDPITSSDPTGAMACESPDECGGGAQYGNNTPTRHSHGKPLNDPSWGCNGCDGDSYNGSHNYGGGYTYTPRKHLSSATTGGCGANRSCNDNPQQWANLDAAANAESTKQKISDYENVAMIGGGFFFAIPVASACIDVPVIAPGCVSAGGKLFSAVNSAFSGADEGGPEEPGTSPPCSFAPETPVLLEDGKTKPIGKIKTGDKVQAADPKTGKHKGARTVQHVWINHDHDLLDLTIRTNDGHTATLHTTANHPFWNDTTHTWTAAGKLHHGDALNTANNTHAYVVSTHTTPGTANRWNLTVQQLHTYYVVAGTTPILVHNCNGAQTAVSDLRASGQVGAKRNIAAAEVAIDGQDSYVLSSVSGDAERAGTVPTVGSEGNPQRFIPQATGSNTRFSDTEFKLLNSIANRLGPSSDSIAGTINLHSELPMCDSCSSVVSQFRDMFPGIDLNVTTG
ncbi:polymorphic toxin-type HINT domain-containing protein [Streptomyces sp. NPDC047022]|uniref:polymorphic toxin-type HINT domain-containing protein n=1 Tax=Streptomyces sp. NPDC047022 TaxID=3155737 RepID=UPI0033FC8EBC